MSLGQFYQPLLTVAPWFIWPVWFPHIVVIFALSLGASYTGYRMLEIKFLPLFLWKVCLWQLVGFAGDVWAYKYELLCFKQSVLVWDCSLVRPAWRKQLIACVLVVSDHTQEQVTQCYSAQDFHVCVSVAVGYVAFNQAESCMNTQCVFWRAHAGWHPVCKSVLWLRGFTQQEGFTQTGEWHCTQSSVCCITCFFLFAT